MNKISIGKRSNARFASVVSGIAIGLGVILVVLGIALFAILFQNNANIVLRILVIVLGALLGSGVALFGIFQIFDIGINNRLASLPLLTYDEEKKVVSFNDISNGGELTRINRADAITLKGPSVIGLKRLYLVYKDGEKERKVSLGFTVEDNAELLKAFDEIQK